jgi:hypothetical protein
VPPPLTLPLPLAVPDPPVSCAKEVAGAAKRKRAAAEMARYLFMSLLLF